MSPTGLAIVRMVEVMLREGEQLLRGSISVETTTNARELHAKIIELVNDPQLPNHMEAKLFKLERRLIFKFNLVT